jgi:hypothetical protein
VELAEAADRGTDRRHRVRPTRTGDSLTLCPSGAGGSGKMVTRTLNQPGLIPIGPLTFRLRALTHALLGVTGSRGRW